MRSKFFISVMVVVFLFSYHAAPCQHGDTPILRKNIKGSPKYSNLNAFQVDSVYWVDETSKQDSIFYGWYYSSQKNKRGFEELTVYQNYIDEIMCGKRIQYMIYSTKGELLSQFVASDDSQGCADGYISKSYGRFIDDSSYELYSEWIDQGEDSKETVYMVTIIKIKEDGKTEERILTRKTLKTPAHRIKIIPVPDDTLTKKIEYVAKDGHRVNCKNSLLVDNWLYDHDVAHSFDRLIPELKLNADFYLKHSNSYIVVFSERNNEGLEDKIKVVNYLLKIRAKIIEVPLNDIDSMDKAMQEKCAKLGIEFKRNTDKPEVSNLRKQK